MLSLLWQIWYIIGLILILANVQILKNNLTIWSHCNLTIILTVNWNQPDWRCDRNRTDTRHLSVNRCRWERNWRCCWCDRPTDLMWQSSRFCWRHVTIKFSDKQNFIGHRDTYFYQFRLPSTPLALGSR